jgi:hypothetical protein
MPGIFARMISWLGKESRNFCVGLSCCRTPYDSNWVWRSDIFHVDRSFYSSGLTAMQAEILLWGSAEPDSPCAIILLVQCVRCNGFYDGKPSEEACWIYLLLEGDRFVEIQRETDEYQIITTDCKWYKVWPSHKLNNAPQLLEAVKEQMQYISL